MGTPAAVAALFYTKERELVERLRAAGATTPAAAKTPDELRIDTNFVWVGLVKRSVIRSTPNGGYYLDEASWEALRRRQSRAGWIIAAVIVLAVVSAIVGVLRWRHH